MRKQAKDLTDKELAEALRICGSLPTNYKECPLMSPDQENFMCFATQCVPDMLLEIERRLERSEDK